jgi:hypothetical protein
MDSADCHFGVPRGRWPDCERRPDGRPIAIIRYRSGEVRRRRLPRVGPEMRGSHLARSLLVLLLAGGRLLHGQAGGTAEQAPGSLREILGRKRDLDAAWLTGQEWRFTDTGAPFTPYVSTLLRFDGNSVGRMFSASRETGCWAPIGRCAGGLPTLLGYFRWYLLPRAQPRTRWLCLVDATTLDKRGTPKPRSAPTGTEQIWWHCYDARLSPQEPASGGFVTSMQLDRYVFRSGLVQLPHGGAPRPE